MTRAVRYGDISYMGMFKSAFHACQDNKPQILMEFEVCCRESQARVYNFGRAALGMPPV